MAEHTTNFSPHDNQKFRQFPLFEDDEDDPAFDAFVQDMAREQPSTTHNFGNNVASSSGIHQNQNENPNGFPANNSTFGNPIQIPNWPVVPSPYCCTCCQTLREFYHVNGNLVAKLDIHGRLGIICHAVLEKYDKSSSENPQYHMFEFSHESIGSVKQFFIQYCKDRKMEGYTMLPDPFFHFYDALCIGIDGVDCNLNGGVFPQQSSRGYDGPTNQADNLNQEDHGVRVTESHVAFQRERTKNMTLNDLRQYFHLPMNEASKELNICPSAIKNICRKGGMQRWPYRKIKSIETEMAKQKKLLNSNNPSVREHAVEEISKLQEMLATIYQESNDG